MESLKKSPQKVVESSRKSNVAAGNGKGKEEEEQKQEVIELLHEYNRIKDATQIVLGALANIEGVTVKQMHQKYQLPLES